MVTVGLWVLDADVPGGFRLEIILGFLALTMTLIALILTVVPSRARAYMGGWEAGNAAGIAVMRDTVAEPARDATATVTPLRDLERRTAS
ncbi:MAG: hypothetical protein JWO67_928 [Streptosporangiaceae bacterium]|nr:hypothetical protein [Streptosporangiaceae bacterium]